MPRDAIKSIEKHLTYHRANLGIDILFESFVGLLKDCKAIKDREVHIIPTENRSRSYRNDIIAVPPEDATDRDIAIYSEHYVKKGPDNMLVLFTSRRAILDYLPEDFYAEPDNTKELYDAHGKKRQPSEIKEFRRKEKERLRSARRFFRPLEVEYNKIRVARELSEIKDSRDVDGVLTRFWGDFPNDTPEWRRFIRTLHLAPFILGDLEKTRALMEFVLHTDVRISHGVDPSCGMDEEQRREIHGDEMLLGYNISVGKTVFDYLEVCTVRIENISTPEFYDYFLQEHQGRKLLDAMVDYYFPINVEVNFDFSIDSSKDAESEGSFVVLGYSSELNPVIA